MNSVLTAKVAGQTVGFPVAMVRDVLGPQPVRRIPRTPPEVAGCFNLRGQIVALYDGAMLLKLREAPSGEIGSIVVFEVDGRLAAIAVDSLGEIEEHQIETHAELQGTLGATMRRAALGISATQDDLVVAVSPEALLSAEGRPNAGLLGSDPRANQRLLPGGD